MEGIDEEFEKLKRLMASTEQDAMECLSLLKFSEGLVRRDIDLVRTQIDIHLKKIESKTLAELQKVYSFEKENIEEVITNLKFMSESAHSFPDRVNTAAKEQDVLEERKKLYRKRIVFEADKQLPNLFDSLNTFGRVILKKMKVVDTYNSIGVNKKTDKSSGTRSDVQRTSNLNDNSSENLTGKPNIIGEKGRDIFLETDPLVVLRSMRMVELKNNMISGKRSEFEKLPIDSNKSPFSISKHVQFLDETSNKDSNTERNLLVPESTFKLRSRMMSECDKKRRARSASPRRTHLNSNTKREKLQGILKHTMKIDNGNDVNQHLNKAIRGAYVPEVFQETDIELNNSHLDKQSSEKLPDPTYFQNKNKSISNESDDFFYQFDKEKKGGTTHIINNSKIVDSVKGSYRDKERKINQLPVRLMFTGYRDCNSVPGNDIEQVKNTSDDSPNNRFLTENRTYRENHVSKFDPLSKPRKEYTSRPDSRIRLPSFDEMLYVKDKFS